ncbi:MAG TPA: transposase, partial [Candidatus Acetothermia bacterium]|nr:transposase [Candidatus Acetothermia bacterium]
MPRTRPPYPPEFRRQIVELVPGVREVAQEFEPSYKTIREWGAAGQPRLRGLGKERSTLPWALEPEQTVTGTSREQPSPFLSPDHHAAGYT